MSKDLKEKAVDIKGKKYVLVADRITYFNNEYNNGALVTELVSDAASNRMIVKATAIPDVKNPDRKFTGYSQAVIGQGMVNTTAALENAETSAVGRSLAMMGIGVVEHIASADEVNKAIGSQSPAPREPQEEAVITTPLDSTGQEIPKSKQCPKHPMEVMYFKEGKYGPFYSHKLADGTFCNTKMAA